MTTQGLEAYVEVQNFGQVASQRSALKLLIGEQGEHQTLAEGIVPPLDPMKKAMVRLVCHRVVVEARRKEVMVRFGD